MNSLMLLPRWMRSASDSNQWLLAAIVLGCVFVISAANGVHAADVLKTDTKLGAKQSPSELLAAKRLFVSDVKPLMMDKCFGCHGGEPKKIKGKLDMTSRSLLLKGGESGDAGLIVGQAAKSPIYIAATWADDELQMPPKKNDRLNAKQLAALSAWINAGAPWPNVKEQAQIRKAMWDEPSADGGVRVVTSGGLSPEWTARRYQPAKLWAYQPIRKPTVPWQVLTKDQPPFAVDAFIQKRLQAANLMSAQVADKRTLLRRATFDLTGLPPTPAQVKAYLEDESPQAFGKVLNRLLASPHYGERMAQHWLDVVRYADTAGFSNDFDRPHAWRYRDYVIRAFNNDKPYDQFVTEQLAGDELFDQARSQNKNANPEWLIAAGFLRMGPWEHTGMSVAAVTRQQWLDDITNSVGVTFLGHSLRCAKCHDHKFDPIPTRDYYRMQAVFAPVQFATRPLAFMKNENTRSLKSEADRIRALQADAGIQVRVPKSATTNEIEEAKLGVAKVGKKRTQILGRLSVLDRPLAFSVYNGQLRVVSANKPMMLMPKFRGKDVQPIHILAGGAIETPLSKVSAGVISAVHRDGDKADALIPESLNDRRTALAKWITAKDNPLAARVIVNRVWQMHFGKALAGNPNNFGATGKEPTHPALLDWLAWKFVENDWSIKKLHRVIMSSRVYQQSSKHPSLSRVQHADPTNELYAYFEPRRLTAEELRDAMLAVSGELNRDMGGFPARPSINMEVAMQPRHIMGSVGPVYQPNRNPAQRNRRTVYALKIRTLRDPLLEVFDQPGPDLSCERRTQSTVTPQVFALFNGQNSYDRAIAMAVHIQKTIGKSVAQAKNNVAAQIAQAYQLTYGRSPTAVQLKQCELHLAEMTKHHQKLKPVRVDPPKLIVRTMVEEMTGLNFSWEEKLDIYQNYQSDLKPWDVDAPTRALADLCLVLFNSNEFVYLY